jgi:hypothetical protein
MGLGWKSLLSPLPTRGEPSRNCAGEDHGKCADQNENEKEPAIVIGRQAIV